MDLTNEICELMYMADNPMVPWANAIEEDKNYYFRIAEVMLDAVVTHLESKNDSFGGALAPAAALLRTEAELARLRRVHA